MFLRPVAAVGSQALDSAKHHPYPAIVLMVMAVTGFGLLVVNKLQVANIEALFLLVVFASAVTWGRRPSLFAALTSVVLFDFCFVPPRFSVSITDVAYGITLTVFVVVALTTNELVLRTVREQAARAQAQADAQAKDALLNRVAHELRGPLTTILGWVQLLQQTADDAQRRTRGLMGVERNAQLLSRLVSDLLDVSRIHLGKLAVRLEPVALAPIVIRALEDAAMTATEKGVGLEYSVDQVGTMQADEHRVEQIVRNLVGNAIKFTPRQGRVTVRLSHADGYARLVVSDNGDGISADFIQRVFEPFSQAHSQRGTHGLGLGLAIVEHLVTAHHGRICVESGGVGEGTTFIVELPLESTRVEPALVLVHDFTANQRSGEERVH